MRWSVKESIAPPSKLNFDQRFQTPLCALFISTFVGSYVQNMMAALCGAFVFGSCCTTSIAVVVDTTSTNKDPPYHLNGCPT
jgi:hypothetical protein